MQPYDPYLRGSATITDEQFVEAIANLRRPMLSGSREMEYYWVMTSDVAEYFDIHRNRIRSKLRRLKKRGLVDGCTCDCRGDISLMPKGEELLTKVLVTRYYGFNHYFGVDPDGYR